MLILGIETSCDETSAAIVEDGRDVLSNIVYSQIEDHKEWGGVIPEIASRLHIEKIFPIIDKCLQDANKTFADIDAISVTNKPGLIGALLIGVNVAKTLAWVHKKPLIPVNHLFGHVYANFIDSDLKPPFICLLASGGHTQIIEVKAYGDMEILGETIDDAAGEAFDKVARLLNLPYPGGPHLDKLAQTANDKSKYKFPISKVPACDFSFSGLKTAALRLKEKITSADPKEWEENRANIAYAFQDCVARTFHKKINEAIERTGLNKIVLAGGVAANSGVRSLFKDSFPAEDLAFPSLKYCTDNAAMIAAAAFFEKENQIKPNEKLDFEVYSRV